MTPRLYRGGGGNGIKDKQKHSDIMASHVHVHSPSRWINITSHDNNPSLHFTANLHAKHDAKDEHCKFPPSSQSYIVRGASEWHGTTSSSYKRSAEELHLKVDPKVHYDHNVYSHNGNLHNQRFFLSFQYSSYNNSSSGHAYE